MTEHKNLIYAIQTLGAILEDKDYSIKAKTFRIEALESELEELRAKECGHCADVERYDALAKEQNAYIRNLEAKIYDLEERIAIMTEAEEPIQPEWEITAPNKDITEIVNITETIEGEDE